MRPLCFVLLVAIAAVLPSCHKKDYPKFRPPPDHQKLLEGVPHKAGYEKPMEDCNGCHGDELRGAKGPSCYTCHGEEW